MPKLQFLTAHLLDEGKKPFPESVPKILYSSKSITVRSEMPRNGRFTVRLSSGPIPFDMVVKVFLDGFFLTGRCFLAGNIEPICDYEISNDDDIYDHRRARGFQFQWPFSKVKVTVHKCFVGNQIPSKPFEKSHLPSSPSSFCPGLPIIADWTDTPPVILHEEQEPSLSIVWECARFDQ
ncbi:hypothetical protein PTTG_04423 [Puccinia triticina 1-1 BBBD Race 1]|uniref:Uncharacterized protein n=2 Tax=Puccinia triticina TaxID=208348 RepID=A0A180GS12_PUCT1|nr:uncharacterized protein PtA15_6A89 [Puccinia triticina]OAV95169.1 hypothetical protein PTTG_04423 [Puccinia triticina 1-1 BBBD Race 1]WAQ85461.1 hypothetical protein PtA15_6A89 [Puccinia triticina]WAR55344.1 hypothetical protein PtB15_6B83 [Puccinia triticina]